jgi:hypothetical protein
MEVQPRSDLLSCSHQHREAKSSKIYLQSVEQPEHNVTVALTHKGCNSPGLVITLCVTGFQRSASAECLISRNFASYATGMIFAKVSNLQRVRRYILLTNKMPVCCWSLDRGLLRTSVQAPINWPVLWALFLFSTFNTSVPKLPDYHND